MRASWLGKASLARAFRFQYPLYTPRSNTTAPQNTSPVREATPTMSHCTMIFRSPTEWPCPRLGSHMYTQAVAGGHVRSLRDMLPHTKPHEADPRNKQKLTCNGRTSTETYEREGGLGLVCDVHFPATLHHSLCLPAERRHKSDVL